MSGHEIKNSDFAGIAIGTLAATIVGAVGGCVFWLTVNDWPFLSAVFTGGLVGGSIGMVVGFSTSWNGSGIQSGDSQTESTPIWGVIPSIMVGLGVGPLVGGSVAMICCWGDYRVIDFGYGCLAGVLLGPVTGVLAWELGFFGQAKFGGQAESH
jgi:hypothetical protein